MTIAPIGLFAGDYHLNGVTLNSGGALKTQVAGGDTALLKAFNTNTLSYTTFATLTAGNPATFNLSSSTTIGGLAIGTVKTLTGDSGGALSPTSGNFILTGAGGLVISGAGSTLTFTQAASGAATSFATDSGTATPSAGTITFTGAGGTTISGSGSTVTITGGGGGTTATVQTTDATPTTLASIATSSNSVITVNGYIAAAKSDYSNSCGGRITATFQNIAGTLTLIGSAVADVNTTSTATFTAIATGTNIIIQVVGIAATVYNWKINYTTLVN